MNDFLCVFGQSGISLIRSSRVAIEVRLVARRALHPEYFFRRASDLPDHIILIRYENRLGLVSRRRRASRLTLNSLHLSLSRNL